MFESDNVYTSSYEDLEVHRLMLDDKVRLEAYRDAILSNKSIFKDKLVLDVGAGTGILSVFCAQAGASKVYAVEASNVARIAKDIVEENGFSNIIEVFQCRIEDFCENIEVDIIVSEWMGFYLLHEGMLSSVIYARDKYLKEDGYLFPEECILYTAPCQLDSFYKCWNDLYGVKMTSFSKEYRKTFEGKPAIRDVDFENLLCDGREFLKINLNVIKIEELDTISGKQVFGCKKGGVYQGICLWFDCIFPSSDESTRIILSTRPDNPATHWKQTAVVLPIELPVEAGDALAWELTLQRLASNARSYTILLTMLDADEESHPIPCDCNRAKCLVIKAYLAQLPPDDDCVDSDESDDTNEKDKAIDESCKISTTTITLQTNIV